MRLILLFSCVLLLAGAPATAQEDGPSDSHQRAAAELVDVLQLEEMTERSAEVMMESMITQNPMMSEFRDIFLDFFDTYFRWEELRPEYVRLYREAYTEAEIHQLIAFYKTPVGQKTVELTPQLLRKSAQIGQRLIQPHLPELRRRIQERVTGGGRS